MEVILLEHVNKLGRMGDKVNVKNGYARNYLLPTKKALRATAMKIWLFMKNRKRNWKLTTKLCSRALPSSLKNCRALKVVLIRQAAETGQLYGSVTIRDIASAMKEAGR